MRAVIIAGGTIEEPDFYRPLIQDDDFVICADSGYLNAAKIGVSPQLVIGDFDSSDKRTVPETAEVQVLPVEKDRTDLHECILCALSHGAEEILLFGARGTRLDHSLAAISLLKIGLEHGALIRLIDEHNEAFLVQGQTCIPKREGYKLSVLPITKASSISARGVYYPLCGAEMDWGNPYGVSNEFTEDEATITVREGILLVMLCRD